MTTGRLARSVLVIPAMDWSALEAAPRSGADLVLMDLDDLVPPAHKATARANVIRALSQVTWDGIVRAYRINPLNTPFAYRDVIDVIEAIGAKVDLMVVPKVDRAEDVYFVDTLLTQVETAAGLSSRIGLEIQIETALGMLNLRQIALASSRVEALVFGPGDYAASLQLPLAPDSRSDTGSDASQAWRTFALHQIIVAARAAGLRAIDGPYAHIQDSNGFAQQCREAFASGYDGKWCLNADQVALANSLFVHASGEMMAAHEIIDAYRAEEGAGRGLIVRHGTVIDAASLKSAQNVLTRARQAGKLSG